MATQNGKLKSPFGRSLFGAILVASCLLPGVIRADDAKAVGEVDLKTWAKQIDLKTCPYDELDFYRALKRDGECALDSRVRTSSPESDAEMLLAIQQGNQVSNAVPIAVD